MSQRVPEDEAVKARRAEQRARLTAHRGLATWGEKLVPLDEFRQAAQGYGRELEASRRQAEVRSYLAAREDPTPVEGPYSKVAVFGGVYNNSHGLAALLDDARRRGAEAVYCLGDFGGFGPNPEKVWPLVEEGGVLSIQGNYEQSLASGAEDCNCGYADPRDNHFAEISYRYTERNCSAAFKAYMGALPERRRIRVGERELLLIHGSPRRVNEFLFRSSSPVPFLEVLCEQNCCDGVLCTHTGLHWHRHLPSGRDVVNVGVIGPAGQRRTHRGLVCPAHGGAARCNRRGARAAGLRPRGVGAGDAPGGATRGVRRDDPHRVVDDLSRDPAGA